MLLHPYTCPLPHQKEKKFIPNQNNISVILKLVFHPHEFSVESSQPSSNLIFSSIHNSLATKMLGTSLKFLLPTKPPMGK